MVAQSHDLVLWGRVEEYRASRDTGLALYYLWLTGELMTHSRQGKERYYDFLENIAPAHLQWTAERNLAAHFFICKGISQYGFVDQRLFNNIYKAEMGREVTVLESRTALNQIVENGQLACVRMESSKNPLYCIAADLRNIEILNQGEVPLEWGTQPDATSAEVKFLSPLDFVSARGRAKTIFDYNYTWEIYKPAEKRNYGPYTMPVLYGDSLVARLDAKLDRRNQTLVINGLWVESWFSPDEAFLAALGKGLDRLSAFLEAQHLLWNSETTFGNLPITQSMP